jgi:hypothetical protein
MNRSITRRAAFLLLGASTATAQTASMPNLSSGTHEYLVQGYRNGVATEPWTLDLSLTASTLSGQPAFLVNHVTKRQRYGTVFRYSAIWVRRNPARLEARWSFEGIDAGTCVATVRNGRITGRLSRGNVPLRPIPAGPAAIPDFAIPAFLTTLALKDGQRYDLTAFRCLPQNGDRALVAYPFSGTARRLSMKRNQNAPLEPVWVVESPAPYPMKVWIAESDGLLLRVQTPEGTAGFTVDTHVKNKS